MPRSSKSKASATGVAKSAKGQATAMAASRKHMMSDTERAKMRAAMAKKMAAKKMPARKAASTNTAATRKRVAKRFYGSH